MNKILTLDLGSTYFKFGLFGQDGKLISSHKVSTPIVYPQPGHWEIVPEQFRQTICDGIVQLGKSSKNGLKDVTAITFCTQTNTFLLLDSQDKPLVPFIVWGDERATEFESCLETFSDTPNYQYITGMPQLSPVLAMAKLLWLKRYRPEIWNRTRRFCLISDYLTLWFTGKHLTEGGAAGLLGIVDIHKLEWYTEVCRKLELPEIWLPELVRAGTDAGNVCPVLSEKLGLPKHCRFIIGCLDQYAGAIGAGNITHGGISETTGTVLATVRCNHGFSPGRTAEVYQGPAFSPGIYFQMLYCSTSTNILDWYLDSLPEKPDYEHLTRLAARVSPGSDGLRIKPDAYKYPFEEGFIGWDDKRHSSGHAVRCIMETVASVLKHQVKILNGKEQTSKLLSLGGAARNDLWLQIKADIMQIPVVALDCPEPTSLGAALLAASALKWGNLEELVNLWVKERARFLPNKSGGQK